MFRNLISIPFIFLVFWSCVPKDKALIPYDEEAGLSKTQFRDAMIDHEKRVKMHPKEETKKAPKLSQIISAPKPPQIGDGNLVSLTVTEDIPLKDVFIELSRLGNVEIEIDPTITGGIIFIAKDRPFMDVIESICDNANLRYSINKGILRVQNDTPYVVSYNLSYLDIDRGYTSTGTISTTTGSDDLSSGSENTLEVESESILWDDIIENVASIVSVEIEPAAGDAEYVSLNQRTGVVVVSTTRKKHKAVEDYLQKTQRSLSAQVLIEAKIVEVTLRDEFQTGIDWTSMGPINGSAGLTAAGNSIGGTNSNFVSLILSDEDAGGADLSSTISFIKTFGTTRTLSSPRLTALNNQQAVLSFTENQVYFEVEYDQTDTANTSGNQTNTTITSDLQTVPIGIILTLHPSIDTEREEVLLNIKPTISSTETSVNDPAVELAAAINSESIQSSIPVVKIKELDTLLRLKNGQTIVMGGLIEQTNSNKETGVPILKDIPLLGYMFKAKTKITDFVETVIFIKATIINSVDTVSDSDRSFYKTFTNDPNPIDF